MHELVDVEALFDKTGAELRIFRRLQKADYEEDQGLKYIGFCDIVGLGVDSLEFIHYPLDVNYF